MTPNQNKLLMSKLRQPVHISYISKYILKETEEVTQKILNELINENQIEESPLSKGYYVVKVQEIQN
jgi:hypothetical protein